MNGWRAQILVGIAGTALAALLVAVSMVAVDSSVARYVARCDCPGLLQVFRVLADGGVATGYLVVSAVAAAACRWAGRRSRDGASKARLRRLSNEAAFVFACIASLSLVIPALKFTIGRSRPALLLTDGVHGFFPFTWDAYYWSMPSGHAAVAFAVAMALYILWPRYGYLYLAGALLVGASRVMTNAHFLGDVLLAAWAAGLVSLIVAKLFRRHGLLPAPNRLARSEPEPRPNP